MLKTPADRGGGQRKRAIAGFLRYSLSSLACAALDYGLFYCFQFAFAPGLSYLPARVVSASVNYRINLERVFLAEPSTGSALRYAALVAVNALAGMCGVRIMTYLGVNSYAAKLALDALMFTANFFIQRRYVFCAAIK